MLKNYASNKGRVEKLKGVIGCALHENIRNYPQIDLMALFADFLNGLARLLKALWLFIAGIISVGVMYYLFTGVEQGIDVVIQSGEVLDSGMITVLSVFLWSFLVWYSSRTLSYIKQHKDDEIFAKRSDDDVTSAALYRKYCIPSSFHQHIPRVLAYNCFVCVQVAIFHLPTFFDLSRAQMVLAIMAHNFFYFVLNKWFADVLTPSRRKIYNIAIPMTIAVYTTFLVYRIIHAVDGIDVIEDPLRHRFWLTIIALVMFGFQIAIVFFFIARRRTIDARRKDPSLKRSRVLSVLGFNPAFNAAEAPYFNLLNGIATVALGFYVLAIFAMPFSDLMGPMALALLALGVLTGFSNLLTLVSIRSSFNVMIPLFALAILFGQWRDPYEVRLVEADTSMNFQNRPELKDYLSRWFQRRVNLMEPDDDKTFPVYLILSNGGASRAGNWTSSVLSHLQDTSFRMNPKDSFKEHVLCIAGASGGSVGNCAFYSLLKAENDGLISGDEFRQHTDAFFHADFLTYTLARLLGPDIFRHLIPFNIPVDNRADVLEQVISSGSKDELLNSFFRRPLTEVFDTTGILPILFVNTTQVENGMPGVISNVMLPQGSQRQDVLSLVDSMSARGREDDMRLSTAAVLSSRFPYVSPAGKVFDRYYVDGGYFDNSGAGTVLELINELNDFFADTTQEDILRYRDRFTFHIVHITNSEVIERPSHTIHPMTNDLLAPLLTLAGMQGSSTNVGNGMLVDAFKQFNTDTTNAVIVYSLYDDTWDVTKYSGEYEEGYPMSWALSAYQLNRMKTARKRADGRNLSKFGFSRPPTVGVDDGKQLVKEVD